MKKTSKRAILGAFCLSLLSIFTLADQVTTFDGSVINGTISSIESGMVTIETVFAGEIKVDQSSIESWFSEHEIRVELSDGSMQQTQLGANNSSPKPAQVVLAGNAEKHAPKPATTTTANDIKVPVSLWKWQGAVGISGKSGNSHKDDVSGSIIAIKEVGQNRIELGLRYQLSQSEIADGSSRKTADETIANVNYTAFFSPNMGWFANQTLERDRFEHIELRSLSSAGITWKMVDSDERTLELATGLANRYESYGFDLNRDGIEDRSGSENLPGLDVALKFKWEIAKWAELNTKLSLNPVFEDFSNYRVDHLSTVDIPLSASDLWKLRISLSNQYQSIVPEETEQLDTSYALSLLLKWR